MNYPFREAPEVWPNVLSLARDLKLAPGARTILDAPAAEIMNIAVRVHTTGAVNTSLEEMDDTGWAVRDRMECLEGDTVLHYQLRRSTFRVQVFNPSDKDEVTLSIDVNMPRRSVE